MISAEQTNGFIAKALSKRYFHIGGHKENKSSLQRKVLYQAVNPRFCITHYPRSYLLFTQRLAH